LLPQNAMGLLPLFLAQNTTLKIKSGFLWGSRKLKWQQKLAQLAD